jgi:anti-sigma factor RsiW
VKDKRFIELLNLYVDHQIAPEEAAELEAEILRSPERRKTYRDYCRMQRGCGMLFDRERRQAPASFALEKSLQDAERKIVGVPARRKAGWGTYTAAFGGFTAMAACLTVVFLSSGTPSASDSKTAIASVPSTKTTAPVSIVALTPRSTTLQPVFASQNLAVGRDDTVLTERVAGAEWMQQVQLPPVQSVVVDDMVFEARPTLQQDNSRVFRSSRPIQGNVEFTAFQFQR